MATLSALSTFGLSFRNRHHPGSANVGSNQVSAEYDLSASSWASMNESISDRSFSTNVRRASRKILCDSEGSRSSSRRNASSLHCKTAELSLARTEADRGMPHSTANSPRMLPGFVWVRTKSFSIPLDKNLEFAGQHEQDKSRVVAFFQQNATRRVLFDFTGVEQTLGSVDRKSLKQRKAGNQFSILFAHRFSLWSAWPAKR